MVDAYSRLGVFVGSRRQTSRRPASFMGGIAFGRTHRLRPVHRPVLEHPRHPGDGWNGVPVRHARAVPLRLRGRCPGFAVRVVGLAALRALLRPFLHERFLRAERGVPTLRDARAGRRSDGGRSDEQPHLGDHEPVRPRETRPGPRHHDAQRAVPERPVLVAQPGARGSSRCPSDFFYYPSSIAAPSASLTVSGDLLRLGGAVRSRTAAGTTDHRAEKSSGPGKGFRDPFATAAEPGSAGGIGDRWAGSTSGAPRPGPRRIPLPPRPAPRSRSPTRRRPGSSWQHTFDAESWDEPSDIDMGILYGTFETAGTGRVQGRQRPLRRSAGSLDVARFRFPVAPPLQPVAEPLRPRRGTTILQRDVQQDRLDFTSTLGATLRPFGAAVAVRGIVGDVAARDAARAAAVGRGGLPEVDPLPRFETRTPRLHRGHRERRTPCRRPFRSARRASTGTFTLDAVLPPLDGSLTARLDASAWILKGRVQAGAHAGIGGGWDAAAAGGRALGRAVEGRQPLRGAPGVSLAGDGLERSTTQLRADGFSASFVAEWRRTVNIATGVEIGPELFLPSTVKVAYEDAAGPLWSWKDRVRLEAGLRTGWSMNVQRYTDNLFEFAPASHPVRARGARPDLLLAVGEQQDLPLPAGPSGALGEARG